MRNTTQPLLNFPRVAATAALVLLVIFDGPKCAAASKEPQPIAIAQLSEWVQPNAGKSIHSTLTFLSDDTVALLLCGGSQTNCRLTVLQISDGRISMVAHKDIGQLPCDEAAIDSLKKQNYTDAQRAEIAGRIKESTLYGLYRYGAGFIVKPLDFYLPTVQWFSRDLSVSQQIPYPGLISRSGATVASRIRKVEPYTTWTIYRVSSSVPPLTEEVRASSSNLLALSDEQVATPRLVRLNSTKRGKPEGQVTVQIESLDGGVLDSVKGLEETVYNLDGNINPSKEWAGGKIRASDMEFAKRGRLYIPLSGRDEIADFQGTQVIRWRSPGERRLNDRHGWSADGIRLLYDRYTQKSSLPRRIGEDVTMIASIPFIVASQGGAALPFPVDNNNEEVVRVLDTASGKACFDWMGQKNDLDTVREYHADISPDGKRVAVLTPSTLALYVLPASCVGR